MRDMCNEQTGVAVGVGTQPYSKDQGACGSKNAEE